MSMQFSGVVAPGQCKTFHLSHELARVYYSAIASAIAHGVRFALCFIVSMI